MLLTFFKLIFKITLIVEKLLFHFKNEDMPPCQRDMPPLIRELEELAKITQRVDQGLEPKSDPYTWTLAVTCCSLF